MTFKDLLSEYDYIQIPLIQRDYVQGRARTDREIEDRSLFVHTLLDATLPGAAPCHLDFIYGAGDKRMETKNDSLFMPLDGQQRLTTLFLFHWILLNKVSGNSEEDKGYWDMLRKFSYKTRLTSENFCRKLIENQIIIENDDSLVAALRCRGWYGSDMKCDPTIQAMLDMIGTLEDALKEEKYSGHLAEMKENLFEGQCITFDLLDLDEYRLTDGLYVKMNARGKELTVFENWKAEFIEFLSSCDKVWHTSYKTTFQDRIEHDWHDMFWKDVYDEYCKSDGKLYPRIDEHFINYFQNMLRMLYFLMKGTKSKVEDFKKGTKSLQDEVLKNRVYLDFLFNGLDWLHAVYVNDGIDRFFDSIFQDDDVEKWADKVSLFGESDAGLNLLRRFVEQSKDFRGYHVLLYGIVKYGIEKGGIIVNSDFREYVRNCRNLLESKSYFDHGALVMQPQVRVTDLSDYDAEFETFIGQPSSKSSIRKKIEDLPFIHGQTMAFEDIIADVESKRLPEDTVWKSILDFIALTTTDKVKVLLSNGFHGLMVGDCSYGKRVFLGSDTSRDKSRVSHWDVIFRAKESRDIKDTVNSFVRQYCKGVPYQTQISKNTKPSTPIDYMLKYDDILCAQVPWRSNCCDDAFFFFAMKNPWENLDMISIHSYSWNPLAAAYQVCPMANAVARRLSFYSRDSFGFVGFASNKEGLYLENANRQRVFEMRFGKMEWKIGAGFDLIPQPILDKYGVGESKVLHATEERDLVEIAVCFMEDVFKFLIGREIVK